MKSSARFDASSCIRFFLSDIILAAQFERRVLSQSAVDGNKASAAHLFHFDISGKRDGGVFREECSPRYTWMGAWEDWGRGDRSPIEREREREGERARERENERERERMRERETEQSAEH
ncbi:unnamed protein product [Closterium sp. NIES-54]